MFRTGLEPLLEKTALFGIGGGGAATMPTARVLPSRAGIKTYPQAPIGSTTPTPTLPPLPGAGSMLANRMRAGARGAGKVLGLTALGAGAAGAYAMHRQHQEDQEKNPLVYAPMDGSFMG